MLYYGFKDYEEFKDIFGIIEHENGVKSRKNKILLEIFKSKDILKSRSAFIHHETVKKLLLHVNRRLSAADYNDKGLLLYSNGLDNQLDLANRYEDRIHKCVGSLLDVGNIDVLRHALYRILRCGAFYKSEAVYSLELMGDSYFSDSFETDCFKGICEDGTTNAVRYRNVERDRIFKMKVGKMFNHIWECNLVTSRLPEQALVAMREDFAAKWCDYVRENTSDTKFKLHVDDNFEDIYSYSACRANFGSCMMGDGYWTFYRDAVDAQAAYLTDDNDDIVARCIIYTHVEDEEGNVFRLAERQYSANGDISLQRQLVNALIRGGHIDGFKSFGSSCHDARAFVDNDGNSLSSKLLRIDCHLEEGSTVSYQDSFKWFDYDAQEATNYEISDSYDLATTSGEFRMKNYVWSEYNGEDIDEDDAVYVETREDYLLDSQTTCALVKGRNGNYYREVCCEDDVVYIGNEAYYAGLNGLSAGEYGLFACPHCGEWFVESEGYYSELTGNTYCCEYCLNEAEEDWKQDNWEFSDWDEDYFEEVVEVLRWQGDGYRFITITDHSLRELIARGEATYFVEDFYIDKVGFDGEPVHIAAEMFSAA